MGKVNNYIKKLISYITKDRNKYEKPWHQYYKDVPKHLNYFEGSMYDNLKQTADDNAKRIAYKYYGTSCTFEKFIKRIDKIADALSQYNVVENECVTLCLPNTPESFELIYAINKIGAIANIVHPLSSTADIERAINETNSEILFCSDVSMPKARNIKIKHFIIVPTSYSFNSVLKMLYNIKEKDNLKLENNQISWETFVSHSSEEKNYVKRDSDDSAAIIYSGGTTGKPKGIIISNKNFNAMALQTKTVCKDYIKAGNSILSALPIFHVFGLALCCHTCLVAGMTCIIVPRLNTKKINQELRKYKPNVLPAVPSMLKLCIDKNIPSLNSLKSIQIVVVGGDYLSPDLKRDFETFLRNHGSNAIVKSGYGLSEATGFCCCTSVMDEKDVINGTLGIPNPDMDVKCFEVNSDIEKSPCDVGEICISGPTIMMGYINEDEETNKVLVTHHDQNVWLHTGDLGYIDENGRIFYSSRLKRMIITNGYNVYPIELENIINKCEYVSSCIVVGVPHKTKGQTPKAVIVLKEGIEATLENRSVVRRYCRENIANYLMPTEFEYRKAMPITPVGKVAYRQLERKKKK